MYIIYIFIYVYIYIYIYVTTYIDGITPGFPLKIFPPSSEAGTDSGTSFRLPEAARRAMGRAWGATMGTICTMVRPIKMTDIFLSLSSFFSVPPNTTKFWVKIWHGVTPLRCTFGFGKLEAKESFRRNMCILIRMIKTFWT